jgi:hypothetical protein
MDHDNLCIATMTWARTTQEEELLRSSLLDLSKLDIPTFVTDGGSNEDFLKYVRSFQNFTVLQPTGKGVWPQVKTSLQAAFDHGAKFIVYTEPDKRTFFKQGLPDLLKNLVMDAHTGVMIAVRSAAGFESYPQFQRMTETTINNCCSEVTQVNTDYTYGPFIMNRLVVPHLDTLPANIGWGWRPYAFVVAARLNYKVESFEGPFFCPPDQQQDDANERVYRMKQLSENIEAIVLGSRFHG